MKKDILIPIVIVILLMFCKLSYGDITKKEKNKFDFHLKRIENGQTTYKARKKAQQNKDRERINKQRESKRRDNELFRKNRRSAREHLIKEGKCYLDKSKNKYICK